MQAAEPGEFCLKLRKAAFGSGDDGGVSGVLICLQHRVQRFTLAGLVHEKAQIFLDRDIQRLGKFACPPYLRDDAAAGLLGGLLCDALPALQLLLRILGPGGGGGGPIPGGGGGRIPGGGGGAGGRMPGLPRSSRSTRRQTSSKRRSSRSKSRSMCSLPLAPLYGKACKGVKSMQ